MPKNTGLELSGDQYQVPDKGPSPLVEDQYNMAAPRKAGMALLKDEMSGVYDAGGSAHPDSPHYNESADATEAVAKAVKPKLYK